MIFQKKFLLKKIIYFNLYFAKVSENLVKIWK